MSSQTWIRRLSGMLLLGAAVATFATSVPALAQGDEARIRRLERDLQLLQQEVFRNGGGPRPGLAAPPPAFDLTPPPSTTLMQRVDDLEATLRRLTGQLEEYQHQLDQLSQRNERLQRQVDFLENNRAAPDVGRSNDQFTVSEAPNDFPGDARPPRELGGPQFGSLGRLPIEPPEARGPLDANADYDTAMNLLTRGQYDRARDAFRQFSEMHPDSELTPQALYWNADIAYSTRKDYPVAAREFAELLKRYPETQRAPESMLKLGLSLLAMGQKQEGCAALAALPARYPNAPATIANRARAERRTAACG